MNEPLVAEPPQEKVVRSLRRSQSTQNEPLNRPTSLMRIGAGAIDPFDTYPPTNLPRSRVQGLIHHFLSRIAFQYYPLDLNPDSNPFVVSWWPLALSDPALFHVSLQTACLDDELHAQKGFYQSEILMRDAVSLVRRKVHDPTLAFQDATMDAVVTMAAIEHGKWNLALSKIHIDAVKRMVVTRGGLSRISETSKLTARMVPWVSMLVMGSPQFPPQDLLTFGTEACAISRPSLSVYTPVGLCVLEGIGLTPELEDVLQWLRVVFGQYEESNSSSPAAILGTTHLHDLTSCIYMLTIHGPTYYSHMAILTDLLIQLRNQTQMLNATGTLEYPLNIWAGIVGLTASMGTVERPWFAAQMAISTTACNLQSWNDIQSSLRSVLWLDGSPGVIFQQAWELTIAPNYPFSNTSVAAEFPEAALLKCQGQYDSLDYRSGVLSNSRYSLTVNKPSRAHLSSSDLWIRGCGGQDPCALWRMVMDHVVEGLSIRLS